MTVSESVIEWLKRFETEGGRGIGHVETDALKAATVSYGLAKTPQETIKKYLSGKEEHTVHFQFSARMDAKTNADRIENQNWLDALTDWIQQRDQEKDYPILREGSSCTGIRITSPYYAGQGNMDNVTYMLTVAIKYVKE